MNKMVRKIVSGAMALCMVAGMGAVSAFAAGPYADGEYTATLTMLHETKDQPSMCDPLFDKTADITVKGDTATVKLYTANPVPAFATQGADGTVKNVVMTLDDVQYPAESDMNTKPLREFDADNALFGINAGDKLPCQVLTLNIPTAKLDSLATAPAQTDAYVNVVMNTDVIFRLKLENITKVGGTEPQPQVPEATETSQKGMNITADVAAPAAKYSVVIPETIAMGTLSAEKDNVAAYTVDVTAQNLGSGKVVVAADAEGVLNSAESTLAYTNTFGTQETSVTAALNGEFHVSAAAVKAAVAGDYAGTAIFNISYFAAK